MTALYQAHRRRAARARPALASRARCRVAAKAPSTPPAPIVPPARVRYLAEIADVACATTMRAAPRRRPRVRARAPGAAPTAKRDAREGERRQAGAADVDRAPRRPRDAELAPRMRAACSTRGRDTVAAYSGDEHVVRVRDREIRTRAHARRRCRARKIRKVALPRFEDHGEILRWLMRENLPGSLPVSPRASSRSSARTRIRRACSRARAMPFRTNRRFKLLSEGMPAQAPVDRVRLGHALRRRSGRAPGHLRQGRQLGRVDRDARRHEGALRRLRPVRARHTSVSMTINGPAPTILAMFFNTAIDQQVERSSTPTRAARRPTTKRAEIARAALAERARHGAGRHPEGRPGPEHLHLLDRVRAEDDGRHPGVLRRPPGAQFLLGVDLRLSHRRSRREPDLAARLHARQRLHLRRGLSRARHARSTTSRRTCRSSSRTAWTRSTR